MNTNSAPGGSASGPRVPASARPPGTSPASTPACPGDLPARAVVVTGAGTGIGRATARAFAADGAHVLAVGRRRPPLEETASAASGLITPFAADVTGPGEPERIVRAALDAYGRLDVLVNNAGIVGEGQLGTYTRESIDAQLATNLAAPVLLTQAALAPLREATGGGVIVNVSTSIGRRAWPGNSLYAASKTALELLTRSWAVDLAPDGIRVAAVAPGAIDTPIGAHRGLTEEQRAAVRAWQLAHTPLGRIGTPEEVAWAVRQLAAHEAAFVTGVVLPVDGGAVVA